MSPGLAIPLSFTPRELPARMQIPITPFEFQAHMVYRGQGHYTHRKCISVWSSPYATGAHGTDEEVLILYSIWLHSNGLIDTIDSLLGMTLMTDKEPGIPCESDVIIAECYSHLMRENKQRTTKGRRPPKAASLGLLVAQAHSAEDVLRQFRGRHPPNEHPSRGPWRR